MMQRRGLGGRPSKAKRISHEIPKQALEETVKAYALAMERTGTSPETRMIWLLNFLYKDTDKLSGGDLLNVSDEINVYASPLKTGYYVWDIKDGKTTEAIRNASVISPRKIESFQSRLLQDLQNMLAGTVVLMKPRIAYIGCVTPNKTEFRLTRIGDPLDLLRLGLFLDTEQLGLARIRMCERGNLTRDRALNIISCGKLFFATDLRQRFCSPACGKEVRWKRYWKDKGEEIKSKRRKGGA